jgi:hypothetical protein
MAKTIDPQLAAGLREESSRPEKLHSLWGCSDPAEQVAVQGVLGAAERGGTGSGATRRRREAPAGVHLGALLDPGAPGPGKVA